MFLNFHYILHIISQERLTLVHQDAISSYCNMHCALKYHRKV